MKLYLKKHPIMTAILLGVLMANIMALASLLGGHHYYYRINGGAGMISEIEVRQYTDRGRPIELLELTSIESDAGRTLVNFDVAKPGSGNLLISYMRSNPDGSRREIVHATKLLISGTGVVFVGRGIFNRSGTSVIHLGMSIYSLLMVLYFEQRRKTVRRAHRYSYDYIGTWAGELFFAGIFLVYAITAFVSVVWLSYVDVYIMALVTRYMMLSVTALSFPPVLAFAAAMTVSNIYLIRHEGRRLNNMLGILCGVGLFGALAVVIALFVLFVLYGSESLFAAVAYSAVNAMYIVFLCVLSGSVISGIQAGLHTPSMGKDFIIILGCGIRSDGTLYPLIKGRVDRALEFWRTQEKKTGKRAVFVPSGGRGGDEPIPEAEAMQRYLLEQGVPAECILPETRSATTRENMEFSKAIIDSVQPKAKIAFSTTNYHVMRSGILASQAGLKADGMGAVTKWYFWPNALLREVAGMFAREPVKRLLTLLLLAVLAGAAGYLQYLIV